MTVQQPDEASLACAREPIQFSGAIQPYGYLLSFDPSSGVIRHASVNCSELFEVDLQHIVGSPIGDFADLDFAGYIRQFHANAASAQPAEYIGSMNLGAQAHYCDLSLHVAQGLAHLEIEPQPPSAQSLTASEAAHRMIRRLLTCNAIAELHQSAAEQIRELTGFDRVMVYRFLADGSGEVIAESLAEDVQSYLGLRYPAADIPPQARALYLQSRVRIIADTHYTPAAIVPAVLPNGQPLDLSQHGLRSVSPVHLEYMRNMGMAASMSISIIVDGQLWGLIACHHRTARQLPPRHRTAADLFGMFYSLLVASDQHLREMAQKATARALRIAVLNALMAAPDPNSLLPQLLPQLRQAIACDALVYVAAEATHADGLAMDAASLRDAQAWLARQTEPVTATHQSQDWQSAPRQTNDLAGLLAVRLDAQHALLFFRREQIEEVRWAGEPSKHLVATDDGVRLAPRRSFQTWRQTVRGQAQAWSAQDMEDAESVEIMLRQAFSHR